MPSYWVRQVRHTNASNPDASSQMQEVNTHGAAGGGVWLRPNACVRAIGTRCRRGLNRQGPEVENLARVTPGCVRDADRRTDRYAFAKIDSVLQTENIYDQSDPWVAQSAVRVRSKRQDERNSTSTQRRRQKS